MKKLVTSSHKDLSKKMMNVEDVQKTALADTNTEVSSMKTLIQAHMVELDKLRSNVEKGKTIPRSNSPASRSAQEDAPCNCRPKHSEPEPPGPKRQAPPAVTVC